MSWCDREMRTPDCGVAYCEPCAAHRPRCDGKGKHWVKAACHDATVEPDGVHEHPCPTCPACCTSLPLFVKQTIVGDLGNCHSATIAALLRIPLEEAWYFARDVAPGESWPTSLSAWMRERGYFYAYLHHAAPIRPHGWHLISGQSPRGYSHSVIGYNGQPVFDPHPDGGFLTRIDGYEILMPLAQPFIGMYLKPAPADEPAL
jgi:hypothetical protein